MQKGDCFVNEEVLEPETDFDFEFILTLLNSDMRFVFSLLFILIFFQQAVLACNCPEWDFQISNEVSDEIFLGKIMMIEEHEYLFFSDYIDFKYTFEISKKWKGTSSNRRVLFTDNSCFPYLENEKEYIIYAYKMPSAFEQILRYNTDLTDRFDISFPPGTRFSTMYCLRTKKVDWYQEEAPFRDEIALLDSVFVEPVILRPHYLNGKNFFLISILLGAAGWIWRKRTESLPNRSSEKDM